jgi:hypothetical protein
VAGYVSQAASEGTITYVEYSYARNSHFPVVKMRNKADYYVEPTAPSVAVALLAALINNDQNSQDYLTQDLRGVYVNADKRTYPLSSYSYMILPVQENSKFKAAKGKTLGDFGYYFLCEGQQQADQLGYSPLPKNLVEAGLEQVRRIPGVDPKNVDISKCNNPTFSADGTNTLAKNAPYPQDCDHVGPTQCANGTGGAQAPTTVTNNGGGGPGAGGAGTGTPGASGAPGSTPDGGSNPSAAPSGAAIDPDTGQVIGGAAGGSGGGVASVPVSLGTGTSPGLTVALMVLAGLLLVGVTIGPPLVSRALGRGGGRQ